MDKNRTIPDGHSMYSMQFTGIDGHQYGVAVLCKPEAAAHVAEQMGCGPTEWGEMGAMGELTPDGTLTTWDHKAADEAETQHDAHAEVGRMVVQLWMRDYSALSMLVDRIGWPDDPAWIIEALRAATGETQ